MYSITLIWCYMVTQTLWLFSWIVNRSYFKNNYSYLFFLFSKLDGPNFISDVHISTKFKTTSILAFYHSAYFWILVKIINLWYLLWALIIFFLSLTNIRKYKTIKKYWSYQKTSTLFKPHNIEMKYILNLHIHALLQHKRSNFTLYTGRQISDH